jgi:tRNA(Ile2) C34 agmatinyltransferase TiaS
MMNNRHTLSRALPACPRCGTNEAVRAMSAAPGQYFCAKCQQDLPLVEPKAKGQYETKGAK